MESEEQLEQVQVPSSKYSYTKEPSGKAWQMFFRTQRDKTADVYVIYLSNDSDETPVPIKRDQLLKFIGEMENATFGDLRGFNAFFNENISDMPQHIEIGFYEEHEDLQYCTAQYVGSIICTSGDGKIAVGNKCISECGIEMFTIGNIP